MTWLATTRGQLEIRELRSVEEAVAAEKLQIQVWGPEIIAHPKEILIPIQHEGGLLAGAFTVETGSMVGLIFGFPTSDPEIQHSQMLATLPAWRGLGIGAGMKWFQRDWCLQRGIKLVRWTVDPLRAANAALNIQHLGGTACRYALNYYGPMEGIDAGAPSDRIFIEWQITSQRVAERAQNAPEDTVFADAAPALQVENGRPVQARLELSCPRILIPIPEDFIQLARSNPGLAMDWRMQTRALLVAYFKKGYQIRGFTRVNGSAYLLEKHTSPE